MKKIDKNLDSMYNLIHAEIDGFIRSISHKVLIKTEYGVVVFAKYLIVLHDTYAEVRCFDKTHTFTNRKEALAWIIFDHSNKIYDAELLLNSVKKTASIENELASIKEKLKKTKVENSAHVHNMKEDCFFRSGKIKLTINTLLKKANTLWSSKLKAVSI
jgi:hypothetical protein